VPLAVTARTQRWSITHVARISFLASVGHVATSLVIAGIIAAIGLRFRSTFETEQGHIVGVILILTGIAFLLWSLTGHGGHSHGPGAHSHGHSHSDENHGNEHEHSLGRDHDRIYGLDRDHTDARGHDHGATPAAPERSPLQRFAAIAGPLGAAASPDLTILPVALAASAVGLAAVLGTLLSFTVVTLGTFVVLTVAATLAGYQVRGDWLEEHGNLITALVLMAIGAVVFLNLL